MKRHGYKTLEDYKAAIEEAVAINGPYSHNIISMRLKGAADKWGAYAANTLIEECELEVLGWEKQSVPPS